MGGANLQPVHRCITALRCLRTEVILPLEWVLQACIQVVTWEGSLVMLCLLTASEEARCPVMVICRLLLPLAVAVSRTGSHLVVAKIPGARTAEMQRVAPVHSLMEGVVGIEVTLGICLVFDTSIIWLTLTAPRETDMKS